MVDELRIPLCTEAPVLKAELSPVVMVAGIKDVQIDEQSIVEPTTRVANIQLGEGLKFEDDVLDTVERTSMVVFPDPEFPGNFILKLSTGE